MASNNRQMFGSRASLRARGAGPVCHDGWVVSDASGGGAVGVIGSVGAGRPLHAGIGQASARSLLFTILAELPMPTRVGRFRPRH